MQKQFSLPPSISFGPDDIPSVMVERPAPLLTDEEIAVVALILASVTSDSLDRSRDTSETSWSRAASYDALRDPVGMK